MGYTKKNKRTYNRTRCNKANNNREWKYYNSGGWLGLECWHEMFPCHRTWKKYRKTQYKVTDKWCRGHQNERMV